MHKIPALPGLLRPGSTAIFAPHIRNMYGGKSGGVVFMAGNVAALVTYLEDCRPALIPLEELSLDLSDATGRLHARMWLAEQGHATQEDRAEVLALSIQSVRDGGGLVVGVVGAWGPYGRYADGSRCYRRQVSGEGYACVTTGEFAEWWAGTESRHLRGPETGDAGKSACDAALLALGWALTNPDGSLTLPPLPEVSDVAR